MKGVADNKSYKNMYHFTDAGVNINKDELPSINTDEEINYTIKENPYKSNVEIEEGELVLQPDLSALFQARGKKHYNGGIDVNLKPNSFIFSDDSNLSFNKNDHKMFELKEGGNFNKTKNTPADVLKRNINTKHYNTMVNNLQDDKKDSFTQKSSAMMLQKYIQTLGNIALLQEQKKDFPDGVPDFAKGSAPVYDTELKDEIQTQKQFGKYGGNVLPIAQRGFLFTPQQQTPQQQSPTPVTRSGWGNPFSTLVDMKNQLLKQYPCIEGDIPCQDRQKAIQHHIAHITNNKPTPGVLPQHLIQPIPIIPTRSPEIGNIKPLDLVRPSQNSIPTTNDVTGAAQNGKSINWEFSPYQLESQGYNALKYASAKRYMPYRSKYNASYAEPSLVNPEQTIGDVQSQTNSQLSALNTLNPILRNAQASDSFGQLLDKIPGIRSQYDNQNSGISNQFRMQNNQNRNQETMANIQNDQNYYQQSITGQTNFDNMKNFLGDQFMNNRMRDVETNQSLAYNLATLGPKPAYGYNFKTGDYYRNDKNILDVEGDTKNDLLSGLINKIDFNNLDQSGQLKYLDILTKNKGLSYLKKKGGRFNPYK